MNGIENEDGDIRLAELRDVKCSVLCALCGRNAWGFLRSKSGLTWKCWSACMMPLDPELSNALADE